MRKLLMTCMIIMTVVISPVKAEKINTTQVIDRTLSAFVSCADYAIVGVCFWLRCGWSGCKVVTTPKVAHYAPDLAVQTYRDAEDPPWKETASILNAMSADHDGSLIATILSTMGSGLDELGGGAGTENKAASHANMTFTLTDSFGNPLIPALSSLGIFGLVCTPKLTPMYPYYISNLDTVAWRFGIPEMLYPQSLTPIGYELGSIDYNWGPYYPRIGHVTNHDGLKESGLIAFRSVHFITRKNQSHIYTSTQQKQKAGFWPPGPLTETSGKWQQISPKAETSCHYMPMPMTVGSSDGKAGYRSDDGNHVWNFWRRYSCCRRGGQWFLGSVDF